jgi:hypothetical protein
MATRAETLKYVGRFLLAFSLAVLLLGRHYANIGLIAVATGFAIVGFLCISGSIRHSMAEAMDRLPRPSGRFRSRRSYPES